MGEEEATENKRRKEERVESLGWITESSVMPKKHRAIEGVGASSILELKAQLYRSQQEARANAKANPFDDGYQRAKAKPVHEDLYSRKNTGVDARATRDKLELKAVNDGSASYAALERKAELYEKLARGELPDEEDKERYCVDFFQKNLVQDEFEQSEDRDTSAMVPAENEEADNDSVLLSAKPLGSGRTSSTVDHDEHKRFVREVHEEVNQARERVSTLKMRRQEQETARREKLRQAYLRKQLEKLKATNATQS